MPTSCHEPVANTAVVNRQERLWEDDRLAWTDKHVLRAVTEAQSITTTTIAALVLTPHQGPNATGLTSADWQLSVHRATQHVALYVCVACVVKRQWPLKWLAQRI